MISATHVDFYGTDTQFPTLRTEVTHAEDHPSSCKTCMSECRLQTTHVVLRLHSSVWFKLSLKLANHNCAIELDSLNPVNTAIRPKVSVTVA